MSNVFNLVNVRADQNPEAVAISAPGRGPLTYGGLRNLLDRVVRRLNEMGVGRNDRVAIVLPNGPEMATAFLAVSAGATSAPLNPVYGPEEFDFYLSDLQAKALVIQSGMDSPARGVAEERGIALIELSPEKAAEAGLFTLGGDPAIPSDHGGWAQPGDVALILHTSGTTSRPKIVPLTGANICTSAHNTRSALDLAESDRCLNVMPLFHIHGLIGATLSSLAAGAEIVCTPGFDALRFFEWMEAFRPTWYTAVPTMHQAILEQVKKTQEIIERSPLRFIRSCSASLPPQVMMELEQKFNVPVIESYGMTEASHQMASNPLPPGRRKPGSVGVAAGPEVAVFDEAGHSLPQGETGEVVIRGPNVTAGYENNPEANKAGFTNGWFRTGDQGYFDTDGYLFLTGRIKEIINRGGEKVAPREVDEALLAHPAVTQAVTFPVPHSTLGEDVAVALVLRKNTSATEKEMRQFALTRLAHFKVPSQIVFVDEIPKGPTGKLQRIGLAEKLASKLRAEYVAPRDQAEKTLANIWAEVLGPERIGVNDNFFRLGGNSLLAAQVVSRVRKVFQVELSVETVFKDPTLGGQASLIADLIMKEIEEMSEEDARRLTEESSD
ncbi:MAG: AMP-binding protein [Gemmatimonadota bacterium]|nr:MAG: AMP-binding protein [Gemmatimonadota bacterium]